MPTGGLISWDNNSLREPPSNEEFDFILLEGFSRGSILGVQLLKYFIECSFSSKNMFLHLGDPVPGCATYGWGQSSDYKAGKEFYDTLQGNTFNYICWNGGSGSDDVGFSRIPIPANTKQDQRCDQIVSLIKDKERKVIEHVINGVILNLWRYISLIEIGLLSGIRGLNFYTKVFDFFKKTDNFLGSEFILTKMNHIHSRFGDIHSFPVFFSYHMIQDKNDQYFSKLNERFNPGGKKYPPPLIRFFACLTASCNNIHGQLEKVLKYLTVNNYLEQVLYVNLFIILEACHLVSKKNKILNWGTQSGLLKELFESFQGELDGNYFSPGNVPTSQRDKQWKFIGYFILFIASLNVKGKSTYSKSKISNIKENERIQKTSKLQSQSRIFDFNKPASKTQEISQIKDEEQDNIYLQSKMSSKVRKSQRSQITHQIQSQHYVFTIPVQKIQDKPQIKDAKLETKGILCCASNHGSNSQIKQVQALNAEGCYINLKTYIINKHNIVLNNSLNFILKIISTKYFDEYLKNEAPEMCHNDLPCAIDTLEDLLGLQEKMIVSNSSKQVNFNISEYFKSVSENNSEDYREMLKPVNRTKGGDLQAFAQNLNFNTSQDTNSVCEKKSSAMKYNFNSAYLRKPGNEEERKSQNSDSDTSQKPDDF